MDYIGEYGNLPAELFAGILDTLRGANTEASCCRGVDRQSLVALTSTIRLNFLSNNNELFCESHSCISVVDTEPTSHHFNMIIFFRLLYEFT